MQGLVAKIPEFCLSHWLLRVPLIVVFFQQGIDKLPVDVDTAEAYELPYLVWWFVAWGEVGAALGLLFGGVLMVKDYLKELGDLVTRFSGITICSIMTGVIWMSKPESVLDVMLYDHFHLMLWVGGLFFALRGNRG
jgi:putative oxidoreductase